MNLSVVLTDFGGEQLKLNEKPLTASAAIIHALMIVTDANQKDDADTKIRKYRLASKIQEQTTNCSLVAEDISFIKEQVAIIFSPLVVGRIFELVDPACFT